jgi:alkylation response protein AidB-like acyl-CoA dehydrogenase
MDFGLNEMQKMLQRSAREFLNAEYPEKLLRLMSKDSLGYTPELWSKLTELGWTGLSIPEEYGGIGDYLDLMVVLQEMGRACCISPYFATLVLGASIIMESGTPDQKKRYLPGIAAGTTVLTLALLEESASYEAEYVRMEAAPDGNGYLLQGTKLFVPHAGTADYLILAARTSRGVSPESGLSLFIVNRQTPGLRCELLPTVDGDKQYRVLFHKVRVTRENIIGEPDRGWEYLQKVIARAAIGRCAEMIGACEKVMEITLSYTKERIAFGHPIGAFQSIQHRSADMLIDLEGSRFITYKAGWSVSAGLPASKEASIAKAWVNQAAKRIVTSAHQIHGAIGFSEDHLLHLYTKRVRTNEFSFGDLDYHLNKIAETAV